tara:strand:- start:685 stop:813 length:129 start_codon:yes stop_codon:yes gene_type:complete
MLSYLVAVYVQKIEECLELMGKRILEHEERLNALSADSKKEP